MSWDGQAKALARRHGLDNPGYLHYDTNVKTHFTFVFWLQNIKLPGARQGIDTRNTEIPKIEVGAEATRLNALSVFFVRSGFLCFGAVGRLESHDQGARA